MKKVLLFMALGCAISTFASEVVYPTVVKSLYENKDATNVIGRLLPTTKVIVVEDMGEKLKVELSGFVQKGKEQAVYFSEGKRILVAAFKKGKNPSYKVLKEGAWSKVSFTTITDKGDFEKELQPMMDKAAKLYSENCSMCHALHPIDEYNANQWPSVLKSMVNRTAIEKKDRFLVIEYLQKTTKK